MIKKKILCECKSEHTCKKQTSKTQWPNFGSEWTKSSCIFRNGWRGLSDPICKVKIFTLFSPNIAIRKEILESANCSWPWSNEIPWTRIPWKTSNDFVTFLSTRSYTRIWEPVPAAKKSYQNSNSKGASKRKCWGNNRRGGKGWRRDEEGGLKDRGLIFLRGSAPGGAASRFAPCRSWSSRWCDKGLFVLKPSLSPI